jgi:hypothetical protein
MLNRLSLKDTLPKGPHLTKLTNAFRPESSALQAKSVKLDVLEDAMDCNVMPAHKDSGQHLEENARTAMQVAKVHSCHLLSLLAALG